ncbi:MAG TPA: hypothetical protein VF247_04460 [Candidatus Krumholzibacteria bacterium]
MSSRAHAQQLGVDGRAYGTVQGDGLHVHFELYNEPWTTAYWDPSVVKAIQVYHRTLSNCGDWQLISSSVPWSVSPTSPYMSFDLVDVLAEPGVAYAYMARALDVTQQPVAGYADAPLGITTHGTALLGRGSLYSGPGGCGLSNVHEVYPCPDQSCSNVTPPTWFSFDDVTPDIAPYINSGTTLHLYGVISGYSDVCGSNEARATFTSATPGECTVATEPRTWGYVKSLYR